MKKPRSPLIPTLGERGFICGQTGSGKTGFSVFLLERIETAPIFIYDTKDESKFLALPRRIIVSSTEQAREAYENPEIDYIIVRPDAHIIGDAKALDDLLFYHYMNFHHSVAYIDEVGSFHNANQAYKGLINLLQRGRSRGITTIMASQRPRAISRAIISEAQKFYVFRLADKDDRKRLGDVIPNFADLPLPMKFGFYFFESGEDRAELFAPIKLEKKFDNGYIDTGGILLEDSAPVEPEEKGPLPHFWV